MAKPLIEQPDPETEIDLGSVSTYKYKLYQTNAIKDLDYTDTINVLDYKGMRLILIPNDPFKIETQLGRYGSDLKTAVDVTGNSVFMKLALRRIKNKIRGLT